ncbi:MAG: prolyl oligopeptidase family serine peptidase [Leptospiraceae bacterium]|nr:prolyl oligopeptidase family serine peptidase [Leptospiraceae bacterium]
MKKIFYIFFFLLFLPEIVLFFATWYFSTEIIDFKKKTLEEDKKRLNIESVNDFGLPSPQEVNIPSDNITLSGWLFLNPNAKKKCGVIITHGHSGTRYGALKYTPLFWKRGCDLLLYEHRTHGKSGGKFATYGYYEKFDMLSVVKYLSSKAGISENKIGIMGESYGAATSLMAASLNEDLAFVAADSPYSDLETIITERGVHLYGERLKFLVPFAMVLASHRADFNYEEVSPQKSAKKINIPVFLSHSIDDNYTKIYHSENIFKNISHSKKVFHKTDWGAAHGKSINTNFKKYDEQMNEFLEKYTIGFELLETIENHESIEKENNKVIQ